MNPTPAKILVCDDEPHLREMVAEYLISRGFNVSEAEDANALHQAMEQESFDLIILDINLPGEDGLTALRRIRGYSNVSVIMLTAMYEVIDRVVGLEMGADDYLGKPVDLRELEARVKATLRRQASNHENSHAKPRAEDNWVEVGCCRFNSTDGRLLGEDDRELTLTAMEYELLRYFIDNPDKPLSRDELQEKIRGRDWHPLDRSIDLHISRLRKKVERHPKMPEAIRTARGVGYIFCRDKSPADNQQSCHRHR